MVDSSLDDATYLGFKRWRKCGEAETHLSDDETVAKWGTPVKWIMLTFEGSLPSLEGMEVQISPQRHAQLSDYAQRHGQDAAAALDEVLAAALEWERLDFLEAVEGVRHGYEDMQAGRTQSAEEMFEELRVKHALLR